ncbi:MAG: Uma2 family endonuclease [Myxococcota bacterium]|jgi:Uma2 family endonuclease
MDSRGVEPRDGLHWESVGATLNTRFDPGLDGPGGWWTVDEPELSLGVDPDYDPVVPDMASWRRESMPTYPMTSARFEVVPDWVCDVLSPGTRGHDRLKKLPFYFRAGVGHAWLVDPIAQSVEVYRATPDGWLLVTTHQGGGPLRAEPFEVVAIDLDRIWVQAVPNSDDS